MLRLKYGVLCGYFIDYHLFKKVMLKNWSISSAVSIHFKNQSTMNTANPFNYVELKKEPGRKSRVYYCTGIYKYVTMHVQCKLILCTATCIC